MGHYRKPWGHKVPMKYQNEQTRRASGVRAGLGGALGSVSEASRKRGRLLGWASFGTMVAVVVCYWTLQFLEVLGIVGGEVSVLGGGLLMVCCLAVVWSHIMVFVCDALTGGDAKPSVWAVAFFWVGTVGMHFGWGLFVTVFG